MKVSLEQVREVMERHIPFNRLLGLRVLDLSLGFARIEAPFQDDFVGDPIRPALHGGVISALIDTCGGAACWTTIESSDRLSTLDLRVDYLRPGRRTSLIAEARVIRVGNRVGVADIRAYHPDASEESEHIAWGRGVYSVRRTGDEGYSSVG